MKSRDSDGNAAADARPISRSLALIVLLIGTFLSPLDYFIVNLALPAIKTGLHATAAELQLIVSVYASAFAVLLVTGGRLGDLFGRKRLFMAGLAGFVLASALCAAAPNGGVLVIGRILQGASASIMVPQILATIRTVFPPEQQTRVMGFYGFVFGFASVAGQLGGGVLITLKPFGLDWQSIFLINVPVGGLALLGAWRFVPENRPDRRPRLDLGGVVLLSLFLALIIYPLTQGRETGWPAWTFVCFAASVPVLLLFLFVEQRLKARGGDPLVDLHLFRNPVFSIGLILAFCFYCDSVFFLTYGIYLQSGLHWSALTSGLAVLPFGAGAIFGPLMSPAIARRAGSHVLTAGFALLAVGFGLSGLALRHGTEPDLLFYFGLLLAGMGHGTVLPSVVRIVIGEIEPARAGLAGGVVTSMLQIGSAFGATAISGIFFSVLSNGRTAADYAHAYQAGIAVAAVLFVVCVFLSAALAGRHVRRAAAAA
ncbi:MFS transporter [Burkholderia plantarii]|uniref:Transporter, major facilitator superfamily MFS n=1 Tax=Burkholderia plantarii TaxID=41899 RepID=A0A0B6S629_BURPL|nr:MFS transporter [Burkholderia plantarii]AJK49839.1 transporter, major facilitator superfamily MFS [Burkholderia plantarii]